MSKNIKTITKILITILIALAVLLILPKNENAYSYKTIAGKNINNDNSYAKLLQALDEKANSYSNFPSIKNNKLEGLDNFAIGTFADTHTIDSAQFTGDTIYEAIQDLCNNQDVGYEIKLESGVFTFYLVEPTNRQNYVVFSRDFDNLISYDRIKSHRQIKNVALVAGEGEGTDRKTAIVNDVAGLDRRELFVDAREISTNDGEVSLADYEKQLQAKGIEKLQELSIDNSIDADIDTRMYKYPVDYEVGDYIKIVDYRGISHTAQITEYITNSDINGLTEYPNFIIKED